MNCETGDSTMRIRRHIVGLELVSSPSNSIINR